MLNNDPDWDPKLFAGKTRLYYGRWTYKYESAARQGAAGAIIVHTTPSAGYPWQVVQTSWTGEQFELPAEGEPRIQVKGWATEDAAAPAREGRRPGSRQAGRRGEEPRLQAGAARAHDVAPARRTRSRACRRPTSPACCRGSDPKLKSEVVIYTAHHDHLGIGEPDATGDKIYNGARRQRGRLRAGAGDRARVRRAAGAAAALGARAVRRRRGAGAARLASITRCIRRFAAGQDRRQHQLRRRQHPRPHAATSRFIGYGKSSLDAIVEGAAPRSRAASSCPTSSRTAAIFYRSDQFNFAKIGVPAMYFDSGTDFVGKPAGLGQAAERGLGRAHLPPAERRDRRRPGSSTA